MYIHNTHVYCIVKYVLFTRCIRFISTGAYPAPGPPGGAYRPAGGNPYAAAGPTSGEIDKLQVSPLTKIKEEGHNPVSKKTADGQISAWKFWTNVEI